MRTLLYSPHTPDSLHVLGLTRIPVTSHTSKTMCYHGRAPLPYSYWLMNAMLIFHFFQGKDMQDRFIRVQGIEHFNINLLEEETKSLRDLFLSCSQGSTSSKDENYMLSLSSTLFIKGLEHLCGQPHMCTFASKAWKLLHGVFPWLICCSLWRPTILLWLSPARTAFSKIFLMLGW